MLYAYALQINDNPVSGLFEPMSKVCRTASTSAKTTNTEIIPGKLYLGAHTDALNPEYIKKNGITAIVTVMRESLPEQYIRQFGLKHMHIACTDTINTNLREHMNETFNFVEDNECVLIHCRAGISRSASICAAYFIRKNRWCLAETLRFITSKRACVAPNFSFLGQLSCYATRFVSHESP
jgi:predicted protein tyrosine phosphatase